ncbi:MAG: methionyl-tRNA formyltransferase [Deltaproteobacteria bacterium]|nr:methionyl-tRNA formyltransferase [Deltaproteobacteria bacterium]
MSKPRIIFMGTPEFALPALEGLLGSGYPVIAAVTQPDRPQGRGRVMTPPPVRVLAERLGIPVLQPEKVRNQEFLETFRDLSPEMVVVAAFGQILPGEIIHGPGRVCLNIHPSLLPKYRGAAPINWALIQGETTTGVTIMQMDEGVDSGDILLQEATPIGAEETFGELHNRLANLGAELLLISLAMLESGTLLPKPQDHSLATLAPRLGREDGRIAWGQASRTIVSLIRGLSPTPGAYTTLGGKQLKIYRAQALTAAVPSPPGTVTAVENGELRVAAGDGIVLPREVQLEGKKRMDMRDFLRGFPIVPGTILGQGL